MPENSAAGRTDDAVNTRLNLTGKLQSQQRARRGSSWSALTIAMSLLAASAAAQTEVRKDFHYTVGDGAAVVITNQTGNISVKPAAERQVLISTARHSDKVEIDSHQSGNRVEARTHILQKTSGDEGRVDYTVSLPANASITIDSGDGQIEVENMSGAITIESDTANVSVHDLNRGSLHIQTVNGPVVITNVHDNVHLQVGSNGGDVQLTSVSGNRVSVKTTTGNITCTTDFSGGGIYRLMTHSGTIDVNLPSTASVDLSARSLKGTVENNFPFRKNDHPGFQIAEGRSFAGLSNSGASSVELLSFGGKIRVKKQ